MCKSRESICRVFNIRGWYTTLALYIVQTWKQIVYQELFFPPQDLASWKKAHLKMVCSNMLFSPCFPHPKADDETNLLRCFSMMSGSTRSDGDVGNWWALRPRFPTWVGALHLPSCSFRMGPRGKGSGKASKVGNLSKKMVVLPRKKWGLIQATEINSPTEMDISHQKKIEIGMSLYHENLWAEPARSSSWISGSWWSNQRTCILWWL